MEESRSRGPAMIHHALTQWPFNQNGTTPLQFGVAAPPQLPRTAPQFSHMIGGGQVVVPTNDRATERQN